MDPKDASIRNRLTLWLASGLFVAALMLAATSLPLRRGPSGRAATDPTGPPAPSNAKASKPGAARAIARWLETSGVLEDGPTIPTTSGGEAAAPTASAEGGVPLAKPPRDREVEEDDEVLFAAMERLERRMAAGMSRARESVLTLEYSPADGPGDARKAAVGVLVDGRRGDVLSVRIDRPSGPAAPSIIARDAFGRRHLARWIAEDPETGLTLLEIPPGVLRSIRPADDGPALGSQVFVVGNPFGLGHSVSRGQVSGLDRSLKLGDLQLHGLIQVQTPLFPGDNGAAVVNYRGQWLGLIRGVLAGASQGDPSGGGGGASGSGRGDDLGYAVTADEGLWIATQLRERGRVDRAYLGVRFATDPDDPSGPEGAALRAVIPDTPAARGGLQQGDRVVSFDGRPIRSARDLTERLDRTPAEKYVRLEVVRGDFLQRQQRSVWIRTTRRPAAPPALAKAGSAAPPPSPVVVPTSAVASPSGSAPAPAAPPADEPRPKPLGDTLSPPQAEELPISLPRAVVDRIDELERRLERLERATPAGPPAPAKGGAAPEPDAP